MRVCVCFRFNGQIWGWVELRCGIPGQPCLVSSLRQDVATEEASTHSDTSVILRKKGVYVCTRVRVCIACSPLFVQTTHYKYSEVVYIFMVIIEIDTRLKTLHGKQSIVPL